MSIYCKIGTVSSQKTNSLLATAKSYELQNRNIICLKPKADTRDIGIITSRTGISRECLTLESHQNALIDLLVKYGKDTGKDVVEAIFIDEAQFLSKENVDEIILLSGLCNFNFLAYGLTSTFTGEPFEAMNKLMIFAKDVEDVSNSLCNFCNSKAKMNMKLIDGKPVFDGEIVSVDEGLFESQYVPVCPNCFIKKWSESF